MRKAVQNRLLVTRRKVSRSWSTYRTKKKHILGLRRLPDDLKRGLLTEAREKTKEKISGTYKEYQEQKYGLIHRSPYGDFRYTNTLQTPKGSTIQKIYKAKKGYNTNNLDKTIPKILKEDRVKGVLVVFSVESEETGQKQYVSNYINKELLKRLDKDNQTIFEYVTARFKAGNTKDYHLKFIYIRVIYEKSKGSKR